MAGIVDISVSKFAMLHGSDMCTIGSWNLVGSTQDKDHQWKLKERFDALSASLQPRDTRFIGAVAEVNIKPGEHGSGGSTRQ